MSLLLPELEAFIAVVKHSTIHGAAKEIGLTQTGVTQRIRSLERNIGTTLFTRSRKGMVSTAEGRALLRYCRRVQDIEGEILSLIHGLSTKSSIRISIAGPSSIMRSRIIPDSTKILSHFKKITLTYKITDDEPALRYLKSGESQLAIIPGYQLPKELDSKVLRPEVHILVAPYSWKSRSLKDVIGTERLVDFDSSDEVTLNYFKKHNLIPFFNKEGHYVNNIDALISLIINGRGYSVLSRDFAKPYIQSKQLVDINPGKISEMNFALAWYPRHEMPKYFDTLIKLIE